MWLAISTCALGRAADFATTWVALHEGRAVEAKVGAAQLFELLGSRGGLIAYEALITTPAIFLGCHLLRLARLPRADGGSAVRPPGISEQMFFFSLGVISLIVAVHNTHLLFHSGLFG
jgi:hypothetical protein